MRYLLLNALFRIRFPNGFITVVNFRPHFDGNLINACALVRAEHDPAMLEEILSRRLHQCFVWMRLIRVLLGPGDRVQCCLGTFTPRRQYLKAWSSRSDLVACVPPRTVTGVEAMRYNKDTVP